jgi:hypothetical protein
MSAKRSLLKGRVRALQFVACQHGTRACAYKVCISGQVHINVHTHT